MYIPEEIKVPEAWTSVRIETDGVDPDVVDDLLYEIRQTRLQVNQEGDAIVVHRSSDGMALRSFEDGVVPDLRVRGFRATWQGSL